MLYNTAKRRDTLASENVKINTVYFYLFTFNIYPMQAALVYSRLFCMVASREISAGKILPKILNNEWKPNKYYMQFLAEFFNFSSQ